MTSSKKSPSKNQTRLHYKKIRRNITQRSHGRLAAIKLVPQGIKLIKTLKKKARIAFYHPTSEEFDPIPLMKASRKSGYIPLLPVITRKNHRLSFRHHGHEQTHKGYFNIQTPPPFMTMTTPDIIFIPLLAFDKEGVRLGYGGGYYDRSLKYYDKAYRIGIAFEAQYAQKLTRDAHDEQLDLILTPHATIRVRGHRAKTFFRTSFSCRPTGEETQRSTRTQNKSGIMGQRIRKFLYRRHPT